MLGITTETASRIIAEFKRSGVAKEIQPHLLQCELIRLRRIAEERWFAVGVRSLPPSVAPSNQRRRVT